MSSQNRIRCVVAAVIVAMVLLAAGPAEAAGGSRDDLSRILDRAWQWLAGWRADASGSDSAGSGGLVGVFEKEGPAIDPNGNPTGGGGQSGPTGGGAGTGLPSGG